MAPDSIYRVTSGEQIDRLIAFCATVGMVGRVELLRATRRGEISLVEPARDAVVPLKALRPIALPMIALLGDDDYQSTGPAGWPATRRLFHWAKGAMVHATGGDAPSYHAAIRMALGCRRFLLIETASAYAEEWGAALAAAGVPFLGLVPADGGPHPAVPARATWQ